MTNNENKNWSDLLFAHDDCCADYKLEEIVAELVKDGEYHGEVFTETHSHMLTIEPKVGCQESLTFESLDYAHKWLEEATFFNTTGEGQTLYTIRDKNLKEVHTQYDRG